MTRASAEQTSLLEAVVENESEEEHGVGMCPSSDHVSCVLDGDKAKAQTVEKG